MFENISMKVDNIWAKNRTLKMPLYLKVYL